MATHVSRAGSRIGLAATVTLIGAVLAAGISASTLLFDLWPSLKSDPKEKVGASLQSVARGTLNRARRLPRPGREAARPRREAAMAGNVYYIGADRRPQARHAAAPVVHLQRGQRDAHAGGSVPTIARSRSSSRRRRSIPRSRRSGCRRRTARGRTSYASSSTATTFCSGTSTPSGSPVWEKYPTESGSDAREGP